MSTLEEKYQTALVRISAHDRMYGTPSQFRVNVPSSASEFRAVRGVQVMSVHLPNTFFNVLEGANILQWYESSVAPNNLRTCTVPPGYYTLIALFELIVSDTSRVSTKRFNIDVVNGIQYKIGSYQDSNHAGDNALIVVNSPLAQQLGFEDLTGTFEVHAYNSSATTHKKLVPNIPNLFGEPTIYICCPELGDRFVDCQDNGLASQLLVSVPNTAEYGASNHYQANFSSPIWYRGNFRHVSGLTFTLQNAHGQLINNNGMDWTIVMKIYYTNRI